VSDERPHLTSRAHLRQQLRERQPLVYRKKQPAAPTSKSRYALPVVSARPRRQDSKGNRKLDDMAAARELGWKGKSYRKAKRFARKLERERVAGGSL
jgi:hypothetical protein